MNPWQSHKNTTCQVSGEIFKSVFQAELFPARAENKYAWFISVELQLNTWMLSNIS